MPHDFDPYHKWLGIPPEEQPPHHYRLLAIPLFESDPDVIESAADQRMIHVRTFQGGRHSAASQEILNELAAARVCLLSPQKKLAYDNELRTRLASSAPRAQQEASPTVLAAPPPPVLRSSPPPLAGRRSPGAIEAHPSGAARSQTPPVFPPLDGTLPDPAPPLRVPARVGMARRAQRISLAAKAIVAGSLLTTVLVCWILYTSQRSHKAAPAPPPQRLAADAASHPAGTAMTLTEPEAPNLPPGVESAPEAGRDSAAGASAIEEAGDTETPPAPASASPEAEPPNEPATTMAAAAPPVEASAPAEASPAEAPEASASVPADSSQAQGPAQPPAASQSPAVAGPERLPAGGPSEQAAGKWHPPRQTVFSRVAGNLQEFRRADFRALLAEAQKADRPSTEVYVLLTFARDRAVSDHDPGGVLEVLDVLESKFVGAHDQDRIRALNAILAPLQKRRDANTLRNLANTALQASLDAQAKGNRLLAEGLGVIAWKAAQQSGPPALRDRVQTHLRGLSAMPQDPESSRTDGVP